MLPDDFDPSPTMSASVNIAPSVRNALKSYWPDFVTYCACRRKSRRYDGVMAKSSARIPENLGLPLPRLCLAITGHRESNAAFAANREAVANILTKLFDAADSVTQQQNGSAAKTRLFSLLAHGADLMAVDQALARGWEITAPLPFGLDLNIAINADPATPEAFDALLNRNPVSDPELAKRAAHIRDVADRACLFELAEADDAMAQAHRTMLRTRTDPLSMRRFADLASARVAAAGRIMIEQSDALVAIWDGIAPGGIGGTRHTIASAVEAGTPVIWINASAPGKVSVLRTPEDLFVLAGTTQLENGAAMKAFIGSVFNPPEADQNERAINFHTEQWHPTSSRRFHAYRRVEALFGGETMREKFAGLRQHYASPENVAAHAEGRLLTAASALPGGDIRFIAKVQAQIMQRFAWADGLSTYLSDAYRGGMTTNFILSALAIIAGVTYLPLASVDAKWPFALTEFILLAMIVMITAVGRRKKWHGRWFETRRVAEYFRHAPIMLLLGVARSAGRWPRGADTEWPEFYAREVLRELGLPAVKIDHAYLHALLDTLLRHHASSQRIYHEAKAQRLARVHHGLDRLSELLFSLAILSVATYLTLLVIASVGLIPEHVPHDLSKIFTFLGVTLPALGGASAGIRYFGDFERFASISEITAEKLADVETRIATLLAAPEGQLNYAQVGALAHSIDDIVVTEIENWQSVFGSKQIAVPV